MLENINPNTTPLPLIASGHLGLREGREGVFRMEYKHLCLSALLHNSA
jgi:hypothetical protein